MALKHEHPSDVAFSPSVKAVQERKGSRTAFATREAGRPWPTAISDDLKAFIEAQTSIYLATAGADGQPYIQHRGGPPGFLRVIDETTIGLVDFSGNRQFITTGNLIDNSKAHLFLIDYARRQRVKIWGEARIVMDDARLVEALRSPGYRGRAEQALIFKVGAWDANCPQHIPLRFEADDVARLLAARDAEIEALKAEVRRLGGEPGSGVRGSPPPSAASPGR